MKTLLVLALLGVTPGGTLYVKGSGVSLLLKPDVRSKALLPLKAGQAVVWLGPDARNPSMHQVEVRGKKGWVPMTSLTPYQVSEDAAVGASAASGSGFASSGKALCTLGDPGVLRTTGEARHDAAAAALLLLSESSSRQRQNVAAHVKAAGLAGGK